MIGGDYSAFPMPIQKRPDPGGAWTLDAFRSACLGQLARVVRASRKDDPGAEWRSGTCEGGVESPKVRTSTVRPSLRIGGPIPTVKGAG